MSKTEDKTLSKDAEKDGALAVADEPQTALAETDAAGTDIEALTDDEDVDSEDSLTFSNGVIEKIVAIAMREVPGVVGMKGTWFNRVQDAFGASDSTAGVTVEVTPESRMNSESVIRAITSVRLVFPVPGGPERMIELNRSASIARRSSLPGSSRCRCPTYSSSERGRSRAASGIPEPFSASVSVPPVKDAGNSGSSSNRFSLISSRTLSISRKRLCRQVTGRNRAQ